MDRILVVRGGVRPRGGGRAWVQWRVWRGGSRGQGTVRRGVRRVAVVVACQRGESGAGRGRGQRGPQVCTRSGEAEPDRRGVQPVRQRLLQGDGRRCCRLAVVHVGGARCRTGGSLRRVPAAVRWGAVQPLERRVVAGFREEF